MVEFGEQLRKAREEKGMTQQSLAEQLYVTRQAVSRWECGDRYPDLLTTKKISQILEVSLDDLLSGKEMEKVVERNPVIENKHVNNIMIMLYACIVISFLITVIDIFIRFPSQSEVTDYSDVQAIVMNILGLVIQIVIFSYGLIQALRGSLSPKRMGVVITVYFGAMCMMWSEYLKMFTSWQLVIIGIFYMIPNLLGAIASFFYFVRGDNRKMFPCMICVASVWAIFRLLYTNYQMIVNANQYLSMNTTINLVLKVAIHGLIVYQTYILRLKRKRASHR